MLPLVSFTPGLSPFLSATGAPGLAPAAAPPSPFAEDGKKVTPYFSQCLGRGSRHRFAEIGVGGGKIFFLKNLKERSAKHASNRQPWWLRWPSRWRAALALGGKHSQATFPENNVWLHGRKQGAKEKDFQPGSGFSPPPTPDTCAKKPDFLTSSAKE